MWGCKTLVSSSAGPWKHFLVACGVLSCARSPASPLGARGPSGKPDPLPVFLPPAWVQHLLSGGRPRSCEGAVSSGPRAAPARPPARHPPGPPPPGGGRGSSAHTACKQRQEGTWLFLAGCALSRGTPSASAARCSLTASQLLPPPQRRLQNAPLHLDPWPCWDSLSRAQSLRPTLWAELDLDGIC